MKLLAFTAVAAAVLSSTGLVVAAPAEKLEARRLEIVVLGGNTLRLKQKNNVNFRPQFRGPRALMRAYQKFGVAIPPGLLLLLEEILEELGLVPNKGAGRGGGAGASGSGVSGSGASGSGASGSGATGAGGGAATAGNSTTGTNANQGEVRAIPQIFDSEYLSEVSIGTPPQTLNLDFDTGSSDLWVFSSRTPAAQTNGQALYDPDTSSTAQEVTGSTWSITYGDRSTSSGVVFTDTVTIGGVTVQNQPIEVATTVSKSFTNDTERSGLLGLAYSKLNTITPKKGKTFFDNALANLAMPVFSANLKKGEAGNYNFGFVDNTEFTGDLTFIDVNTTTGFWQFAANGLSIGNSAPVAFPHQGIADTGTTLLLLPPAVADLYYRQVPQATNNAAVGGYTFPCDAQLPDVTFQIGTYNAVVPGELINFAPVDDRNPTNGLCFGGIQSNSGLPFAIYGDIFLKGQFVLFDGGNNRLGMAPKPI